jgi:hypothetical protein
MALRIQRTSEIALSGYTPVYRSITTGTLAGRWPDIGLWAVCLSLCDKNGEIDCTHEYISMVTGLPLAEVRACMARFCLPDPGSRSQTFSGARLVLVADHRDWGWRVVNHEKYREKARKAMHQSASTASGADAERQRLAYKNIKASTLRAAHAQDAQNVEGSTLRDGEGEQEAQEFNTSGENHRPSYSDSYSDSKTDNPAKVSSVAHSRDPSGVGASPRGQVLELLGHEPPPPPGRQYTAEFEAFWQACPRRIGKLAAQREYGRARRALGAGAPLVLLRAMKAYAASVSGKDERYVAHPRTWLSQGRWDDQPTTPLHSGPKGRDQFGVGG